MLLMPANMPYDRVSAKLGNSGKSGKHQENDLCLENINEKSGNSANNVRDNQGNTRENVYLCFFNQSIDQFPNMLKNSQENGYLHNEIVGFHFSG